MSGGLGDVGHGRDSESVGKLDEGGGGLLWDDCIAKDTQSVQPSGNPIIHSTNAGFRRVPSPWLSHAKSVSVVPLFDAQSSVLAVARRDPLESIAVGVGSKGEEPLSPVRSANALCRSQCCRNAEAHRVKLFGDDIEPVSQMVGDVLDEDERRSTLAHDPCDLGPEVSRIVSSESKPHRGERLTRVSRSDEIHDSTPRDSVESVQVRPDRKVTQVPGFHSADKHCRGERVPLHSTDDARSRYGKLDTKIESGDSRAQTEGT